MVIYKLLIKSMDTPMGIMHLLHNLPLGEERNNRGNTYEIRGLGPRGVVLFDQYVILYYYIQMDYLS